MNTQHTPGKWKLHDPEQQTRSFGQTDKRIMVLHPDGERLIACCSTGTTSSAGSIPREERLANARLIAAAPDLLEALESSFSELNQLAFLHDEPLSKLALDKARTAIAKAKYDISNCTADQPTP